mmetsp:Transcript_47258/g.78407  ORF Transcript_47258/g.78407 Transcript_47258/m.78407 type:complete len:273 (+) Transcript_47258:723-1541(+)
MEFARSAALGVHSTVAVAGVRNVSLNDVGDGERNAATEKTFAFVGKRRVQRHIEIVGERRRVEIHFDNDALLKIVHVCKHNRRHHTHRSDAVKLAVEILKQHWIRKTMINRRRLHSFYIIIVECLVNIATIRVHHHIERIAQMMKLKWLNAFIAHRCVKCLAHTVIVAINEHRHDMFGAEKFIFFYHAFVVCQCRIAFTFDLVTLKCGQQQFSSIINDDPFCFAQTMLTLALQQLLLQTAIFSIIVVLDFAGEISTEMRVVRRIISLHHTRR